MHRDLKPANVLIDDGDRALLTDFGLAKFLDPPLPQVSQTTTGKILGTPQYMAPEQVAAQPATMATDVYGIGGILYFLLCGKPPVDRRAFIETCQAVRSDRPVLPSTLQRHIPRDLETICLKCLAKEPESRYHSVDALLQDLNAFQKGRPIQARPVTTVERLGYWARRNRVLASLSASLIVGGLISLLNRWTIGWRGILSIRSHNGNTCMPMSLSVGCCQTKCPLSDCTNWCSS